MDTAILTNSLSQFLDTFNAAYGLIWANGGQNLLWLLAGIELVLIALWWALGGNNQIVDAINTGEVPLVINTTSGASSKLDSRPIRQAALMHKVPYYTTVSGAIAAATAFDAYLNGRLNVCPLQDYFTTSG